MNNSKFTIIYRKNSIWHEITEHKAVYNMAELAEVLSIPEADAKICSCGTIRNRIII